MCEAAQLSPGLNPQRTWGRLTGPAADHCTEQCGQLSTPETHSLSSGTAGPRLALTQARVNKSWHTRPPGHYPSPPRCCVKGWFQLPKHSVTFIRMGPMSWSGTAPSGRSYHSRGEAERESSNGATPGHGGGGGECGERGCGRLPAPSSLTLRAH